MLLKICTLCIDVTKGLKGLMIFFKLINNPRIIYLNDLFVFKCSRFVIQLIIRIMAENVIFQAENE